MSSPENSVLLYAAVIACALFFYMLAKTFRRTLGTAANPAFVMEKPPLPKGLSETVVQIERWKAQGRVSREEYERLMHLCREDAEALTVRGKDTPR
jgi:hypothetical protein